MKCPLHKLEMGGGGSIKGLDFADCSQEECAWWVTYEGPDGCTHAHCAISHIPDMLFRILEVMSKGGKA